MQQIEKGQDSSISITKNNEKYYITTLQLYCLCITFTRKCNEEVIFVAIAEKDEYKSALPEQQKVRDLVMARLEQIKEGKTKCFNAVCDRFEKSTETK